MNARVALSMSTLFAVTAATAATADIPAQQDQQDQQDQQERITWAKDLGSAEAQSLEDGRPVVLYFTFDT
jgi:hypothetical protein